MKKWILFATILLVLGLAIMFFKMGRDDHRYGVIYSPRPLCESDPFSDYDRMVRSNNDLKYKEYGVDYDLPPAIKLRRVGTIVILEIDSAQVRNLKIDYVANGKPEFLFHDGYFEPYPESAWFEEEK